MRHNKTQRAFLIRAGLIVGAGGLIFGYDIGVISGTLGQLKDEFSLNNFQEGLVVSILYGGSILGSIIGGPLCDRFGRWRTIHVQNALFILGSLVTGGANSLLTLCVGRFIVGIASAISGIACVPYLTEISPAADRGLLSSQYEILVCVGILLAFCSDLIVSSIHDGWRIAFFIPAIVALLQSISMCWLPDSPKWLIEKGRIEEAKIAIEQIYGTQYLLYEIDSIFSGGKQQRRSRSKFSESGNSTRIVDLRSESLPQDLIDYQNAIEKKQAQLEQADNAETSSNPFTTNVGVNSASKNRSNVGFLSSGAQKQQLLQQDDSDSDSETDFDGTTTIRFSGGIRAVSAASTASKGGNSALQAGSILHSIVDVSDDLSPDTGLATSASESQVAREFILAIYVIVVIQVLAQITGANVVRNYAPTIFEASGASSSMSLVYNVILGVVKLLFTVCSVWYIDTTGRKSLFVLGICVVSAGMLFLSVASLIAAVTSVSHIQSPITYTIGCALVYAGFGISYGPIPWIMSSELFPTIVRGRIMSISLIASNVAQLVTNMVFLLMNQYMTTAGTFGFFFVLNVIALLYVYLFLVETKEISPADILTQLRLKHKRAKYTLCCGASGDTNDAEHQQLYSQLTQTQETANVLHGSLKSTSINDVEAGSSKVKGGGNVSSSSGSKVGTSSAHYSSIVGGAESPVPDTGDDDNDSFDNSRHLVRISQSEDDFGEEME